MGVKEATRLQTTSKFNLGRVTRYLFLTAADIYAASMAAYLVVRALSGNRFWPVALISTFLHWLLLPALVLLPVMLWRRRWWSVALLGVCALAFGWWFGPLFVSLPHAHADDVALTVMTANVGEARYEPSDKLIEVIRDSGADIVALQEFSSKQQITIEQELSDLYPYRLLYGFDYGNVGGKGLLSRYPILEAGEPFRLHERSHPHLRAVIDVDGQPVTVIVAHPPRPILNTSGYRENPYAADEIATLAAMATADGPGILVGDFNTTDQGSSYPLVVEAGMVDAFREVGWGFGATWPVRYKKLPIVPLVRIDYIWHTEHFQAVEAWVGPKTGADHLPVLAKLVWRE